VSRTREQRGWYFYDWANSAFYTTVITLFLGPYLTELARRAAVGGRYVHPFGIPVDYRSYWGYLVALSVATQLLALPVVGAWADASGRKKHLLGLFAYLGSAATMAMYWLHGDRYLLGGALFLVANLAFGASTVIYNAFLPEISTPEERDAVSAKGWGLGYAGGGLLLALNLLLYQSAPRLGLPSELAVRISLASAGAWWAAFSLIPLATLQNRPAVKTAPRPGGLILASYAQFFATMRGLRRCRPAVLFLAAYLLYNDGIQTVITQASHFGSQELKIPIGTLTLAILMVQFLAFFGALLFNWIAARLGSKNALMLSLALWTAVLVFAYVSVRTTAQFFIMAALVALVLGGSQALSRSLFSLMIPKGSEAEYFSLYEISDKGTSWLGPLIFGLGLQFTGDYRLAILTLIVFFLAGMTLLARVPVPPTAAHPERHPPNPL
jgi:UMF1 family MFS transporter